MLALSEWREDPAAASRVFQYASPSNQAATGPLDRFRKMVESKPYTALLDNSGWTVGVPMVVDRVAIVLVTLVDDRGKVHAFRFYLSRPATDGALWMTDAVLLLPVERPRPEQAPPDSAV